MYCEKCGKETSNGARLCEECNSKQVNKPMLYASIVMAILGVILPFFKWLEVPIANGLYSMFGMGQEAPTFSLFGYIFAGSQYQNGLVYAITIALAIVAIIGIIFNIIYIIKALKNKPKNYKYGTIGAIILTVVSILFIVIVGLMCLILKIFKLTVTPYITLVVSIVNIIIIKKLKKNIA